MPHAGLCNLKIHFKTEVQSSFYISHLDLSDSQEVCKLCWETHYKQADNTGRFTPSPHPPFQMTQYLCTVLFLTSELPTERCQSQLPLCCWAFFSSIHPILTKGSEEKTPLELKLVHWLGKQELFLVPGFTNMQRTDGSNRRVSLPTFRHHPVSLYPRQQDWVFMESNILLRHYSELYFKGVAGWLGTMLHMQTESGVGQPVTQYSQRELTYVHKTTGTTSNVQCWSTHTWEKSSVITSGWLEHTSTHHLDCFTYQIIHVLSPTSPSTANRLCSNPVLLQWVQNVMYFTTRRFVFPAFGLQQQNKNQALVALDAGFFFVSPLTKSSFRHRKDSVF